MTDASQYIYTNSPYYLNLQELWTDWPQRDLGALMKVYTLVQCSYWSQQVLAVNMEARRKDYLQVMVHHFLTITLIAAAYAYHFTRVGNLILVLMDTIELIFPVSHSESHGRILLIAWPVCQMPQIPRLHHALRCRIRRVHGHLARDTPRVLPHDLLERLY